jgi:hypothetical protein
VVAPDSLSMTEPPSDDLISRIEAVLGAFAAGEAMGRATEEYAPDEIIEMYEDAVTDFVEPVRLFDDEVWAAGETGDGTTHVLNGHGARALPSGVDEGTDIDLLPLGVALGLRCDGRSTSCPGVPSARPRRPWRPV